MSQAAQAAGPAVAAPAGSSGNSGAAAGGEGGTAFDPKAAIAEIRRARGETQKLQTAFDSYRQETAPDRETMSRLKQAISPQAQAAPDPIAALEREMDSFLDEAMALKARGQDIPLTSKIAMSHYQSQIENLKVIETLKKELAELKSGVQAANNPDAPVDNLAYAQMNTFLEQSLDNLYGTDPKQTPAKKRVYGTVVQALSEDLKALQKENPGQWQMLRRNPMKMQQVVNDVLRTIVPPKAMQMIEQQELEATPMTKGELWGAFNEARALFAAAKTDDQKLDALHKQRQIREKIHEIDNPAPRKRARR